MDGRQSEGGLGLDPGAIGRLLESQALPTVDLSASRNPRSPSRPQEGDPSAAATLPGRERPSAQPDDLRDGDHAAEEAGAPATSSPADSAAEAATTPAGRATSWKRLRSRRARVRELLESEDARRTSGRADALAAQLCRERHEGVLRGERAARHAVTAAIGLGLLGLVVQFGIGGGLPETPLVRPLRQFVHLLVALSAGFVVYRMGFERVFAIARVAFFVLIALIAGLTVGRLTGAFEGTARWLRLPGGVNLQPSELLKFALIVTLAHFAVRRGRAIRSVKSGLVAGLMRLALPVALVAAAPDLGQALFLAALGTAMLFVAGVPRKLLLLAGLGGGGCVLAIMYGLFAYIRKRIDSFREGGHDQVLDGLAFIARGGLSGQGVGGGRAAMHVPEVHTDFVMVATAEQFGALGVVAIIAAFGVIVLAGARIAATAGDRRRFLVAYGVAFAIALQVGINLAVVAGLVPPKGIALPFVSYGGSVALSFAVGIGLLAAAATPPRAASAEAGVAL